MESKGTKGVSRRTAVKAFGTVAGALALGPVMRLSARAGAPAYTFRLGFENTQDHFLGQGMQFLADAVGKRTEGQVAIRLFPNSQLGTGDQVVKGLQLGSIDMAHTAADQMEILEPMMGISSLPFSIRDYAHGHRVEDGPVMAEASRRLEEKTGIHIFGYFDNGFRYVLTREKPIRSVEDFQGLKIRIPNVPTYKQMFELVGATPVVIAFGEIYSALQTKVVDGMEGAPAAIQTSKFFEVAKYLASTKHIFIAVPVAISGAAWKRLPAPLQKAMQEAFSDALAYHRQKGSEQADAAALTFLTSHGLTETQVETKPIQQKMQAVYESFGKAIGGGDWIQRMLSA
jgi:TRAP-type transport system periplasmic protein